MNNDYPIKCVKTDSVSFLLPLLEIPKVPRKIYIKGNILDENLTFLTVVGSRSYTSYGKEVCKKIISGLSGYSIVIVSGLALGIDSIAHTEAIDAGLLTLSIPGSGLSQDVIYPESNKKLAKRILDEGGTLLSEYPPNTKALPYMFPERNRLMAGISRATLIIEASAASGTLITARLALDYNRDVLAVPGSVFSRNSYGANKLIADGATCITSSEDVLNALNIDIKDKEKTNLKLSPEEKEIVDVLNEPKTIDEISRELHTPIHKINILISKMEINGIIKQVSGKFIVN